MGMARRAPDATYRRQFVMTAHAIERFRERVDEEFTARSDEDLGNLLDERIRHNAGMQTVTDLRAGGEESRVFRIENRDGRVAYAVVRGQHVVTVLDEHMLELNFTNGSWKRGPMNQAFRKALKGVVVGTESPTVDRRRAPNVDNDRAPVDLPTIPSMPVVDPRAQLADLGVQLVNAMYDETAARVGAINAATALREAEAAHDAARSKINQLKNDIQNAIDNLTNGSHK